MVLSPAWHPSGRSIAYSAFGPRGTQIVVREVQGGGTRVASARPGLNITPEFSPDGSLLIWAFGEESGADLVAAPYPGGGDPRRITVARGSDNVSPSFSPDGRRLAYTSNRAGHPEIYTVDVDGANVELLTTYLAGDQSYRSNPAWSPDGRVVAFQSQVAGRFQIMTISLRDRSMKQLTSEGINEDPAWAPDGRHLVFTSTRTGTKQLFVLDAETGRARQLTRAGGARLAAWSRVLDRTP
jgi:TolB protein